MTKWLCGIVVLLSIYHPFVIVHAEIADVQIDTEKGVTTVEVSLSHAYKLRQPAEAKSPTKMFVLHIDAMGEEQIDSWSSTEFSFDETDHDVESVTLEGDSKKGFQILVSLRVNRHVEILPQFTHSHVLFTISSAKEHIKLEQNIGTSKLNRFALSLGASGDANVSLTLPSKIATEHIVYAAPGESQTATSLRAGFWDSERAARQARAQIVEHYPEARVIAVDGDEEIFAYKYRLNPRIGLQRADLIEHKPAARTPTMAVSPMTPETIGRDDEAKPSVMIEKLQRLEEDPLMKEADDAFRVREYGRAIGLYTKLRLSEDPEAARSAHEKLSVARELNGQLAHATSLYREYLQMYPSSRATDRIRQRLDALTALADDEPKALKSARGNQQDWRSFANISQFYRRHSLKVNEDKSVPIDGVFTNVALSARKSTGAFDQEGQLSLTHLLDQTGNLDDKTFQISSAYWDAYSSSIATGVKVGRQSNYDAGVIGRFDGASVRHHVNDQLELGLVAGFLLDSSFDGFTSQRPFQGIYGSYRTAGGALTVSPFVIQQEYEGTVDRQAVGLQSRWMGETRLIMALVDYDFHHQALNNVTVMANLGVGRASSLSLAFDQRRSPYITTRNALIGQPFDDLSDLERELVDLSLKELAADRTATSRNIRLAWNRKLGDTWEFTTDVVVSDISATDSSANVVGFEARQDNYYSTQVRANNLFGPASYSGLMIRRADGETSSTTSLYWNNRIQLGSNWSVYPRIRLDQRTFSASDQSQLTIIPTMRVDYSRSRRFRFEFEIGYESTTRETSRDDIDITGVFFNAGYRAVF